MGQNAVGQSDDRIFGPSLSGENGSYDYVIMSLGKRVFSKTARMIFLKLLMKLGCLQGKKLVEPYFWEKKYPKNRDFWILQKMVVDV